MAGDASLLSGLIFKAAKSEAFMIGGGFQNITHYGGINTEMDRLRIVHTTAREFDGSLSGALVREAISVGKVTQKAKQSTLHAEVITILSFIYAALIRRLQEG